MQPRICQGSGPRLAFAVHVCYTVTVPKKTDNPRSFRLHAETLARLQKIASDEDRSVNYLVQVAADQLIDEYKRKGAKALKPE
jgi:hypothetical protein